MKNWYIYNNKEDYEKLKDYDGLSKMQKIIVANRQMTSDSQLRAITRPSIKDLYDPFLLKDMDKAVELIVETMMMGEKIRIVGDYDQDGVSATVTLLKGLGYFHEAISYSIPDRVEDGYGISKGIVDRAIEDDISLIITCDNGISAFEVIDYAKEKNLKLIVTDHHTVPLVDGMEKIPQADAVINPMQKDCGYPFKKICGAAVAYKLVDGVYSYLGEELGMDKELIYELLEFTALATVADVMDIEDENRIIVVEGLKRLNKTRNPGLRALLSEMNWDREIDVYTIGFIIGPTINSTGRIFTAKLGVELFIEDDMDVVSEYARELVDLNNERKNMTLEGYETSLKLVNEKNLYNNDIMIVYNPSIHESICGLVAGRIKDKFHKPTIVLTDAQGQEGVLKGSGRSIEAYDMFNNLNDFKDIFISFGGHKMACGLSIEKSKLDSFIRLTNENSSLEAKDFIPEINIDVNLPIRYVNNKVIEELEDLKPFGKGFEKPKFASKQVTIKNISIIGKKKNVVRFIFNQDQRNLTGISFDSEYVLEALTNKFKLGNIEDNLDQLVNRQVDIIYYPQINNFNNQTYLQLLVEDIR